MIYNGANADYIISLHLSGYIGAASSDVEHSYSPSVCLSNLGLPNGNANRTDIYTFLRRKYWAVVNALFMARPYIRPGSKVVTSRG